jgi:ankyrin repeat protein
MLDTIIYYVQHNGFQKDTIPILFTNKSFYNNHYLWHKIVNLKHTLTPLMCASYNINYDRVKFLLDSGAYVNTLDSSKQPALLYTLTAFKQLPDNCTKCPNCNHKRNEIIKIINELCECNQNLNILTITLDNMVMFAIKLNFIEAIEIFCKYDFDINHKNINGKTAMSIAIANISPLICYYLWKKGADINTVDSKKHTFLMTMVYEYNESITYEMIEEVLQNNPDMNALDSNNCNALAYACSSNNLPTKIVELLVKYGVDVHVTLYWAIDKNKIDYINILCKSKHKIFYDDLIKYAKKSKNKVIEKLLIKNLNKL